MNKWSMAFLPVVVFLLCGSASAGAEVSPFSLIANPGFEVDDNQNDQPDHWTPYAWNGTGTSHARDADVAKSGEYSVRLIGDSSDDVFGYIGPEGKFVVPNQAYEYAAYIKTENVAKYAYFAIIFRDIHDDVIEEIHSELVTDSNGNWKYVSLQYVAPADAVKARFDVRMEGAGTTWFDDVNMEPVTAFNKVSNGAAEQDGDSDSEPDHWQPGGLDIAYSSVTNSGFEEGTSGPTGWDFVPFAGSPSGTWDNSTYASGTRSLKIVHSASNDYSYWNNASHKVNIGQGGYWYNVYIKTENVTQYAAIALDFYTSSDVYVSSTEIPISSGTHDWELVSKLIATPVAAAKVRINLAMRNTGTVWFDDISVTEQNWIVDSSFDADTVWDSNESYDGAHSLKIASTDPDGGVQWSSDDITVIQGTAYSYQGFVKTDSVADKAVLAFVFKDSTGEIIKETLSNPLQGTNGWTEINGVIDEGSNKEIVAPLKAATVRVDLRVYGSGTAWFDSIRWFKNSFNRLANPGTEYADMLDTAQPEGWETVIWDGTSQQVLFDWNDAVSHTAQNSLHISVTTSAKYGGYVSKLYEVEEGKPYEFSGHIKTDSVSDKAILHLVYYNAGGSVVQEVDSSSVSGTTDWTYISVSHTTPATAVKARLDLRLYSTGEAWFDDLSMYGPVAVHPDTLYSSSDLTGIRSKLTNEPFVSEYNRQKTESDFYSLNDLDNIASFSSWRDLTHIFVNGIGAEKVRIQLKLKGTGTVWLDNVRFNHASRGMPVEIDNYSFEEGSTGPDDWSETTWAGNPDMAWVDDTASRGSHSVKITNDSADDEGGLTYDTLIPVESGDYYAVQISIKQDALSSDGVYIVVTYLDGNDSPIGSPIVSEVYNKAITTRWDSAFTTMLSDADVYMNTGTNTYAEKVEKRLNYILDDIIYNLTADTAEISAYGAVHLGRALLGASIAYDMIKDAGIISANEDAALRMKFSWLANILNETVYYPYQDNETYLGIDHYYQASNYNTDRFTGVGMFAMVFPEYTASKNWLQHAEESANWQFANVVLDDGAWPESIRYHGAVLRSFIPFAIAMKRYDGTDLFANARFKNMFKFMYEVQTPEDAVNTVTPNVTVTPGIGDSLWENSWLPVLGWAAPMYSSLDPTLSKHMMATWKRGGSRLQAENSPGFPTFGLLFPDPDLPEEMPVLRSTVLDGIGYVIFRQSVDQPEEDYFIYRSSPFFEHNHYDQGSFSIYSDSTPLILDPGSGDYSNGDVYWYNDPISHNRVAFKNGSGVIQGGTMSSEITDTYFSDSIDYVQSNIPDVMTSYYHRHINFVKDGYDAYVVWDDIDSSYNSQFSLHTLSTSTDINGSTAVSHGYNDKDVETTFLLPSSVTIDKSIGGIKSDNGYPQEFVEYLKVEAGGGEDYLAIIYPKGDAENGLTVVHLTDDKNNAEAYHVEKSDGSWFVIVLNSSASGQYVGIETDHSYQDMRTADRFHSVDGATTVPVAPRSMRILKQAESVVVYAAADAYVRDDAYANINYGSSVELITKHDASASYSRNSFIRFDLSGISGDIASAKVRLRISSVGPGTTTSKAAFVSDDSWVEGSITWNNMPTAGADLASWVAPNTVDGIVEFDVTAQVQTELAGDGLLSLKIYIPSTGDDQVTYYSRENGVGYKPELVVTLKPVIYAEADAYVRDGAYANTNYGSSDELITKHDASASYSRSSFIRFDLSGISGDVAGAKVRLRISSVGPGTTTSKAAFVGDDSWAEGSITWNTMPTAGADLASWVAPNTVDGIVEFDVTAQVQTELANDGKLSLKIYLPATGDDQVTYYSREHDLTGYQPELIIALQ